MKAVASLAGRPFSHKRAQGVIHERDDGEEIEAVLSPVQADQVGVGNNLRDGDGRHAGE